MALACDVAVAAESARFTLGYQNIGLSPDGGMTFFLARALGTQRAMEMTLFGTVLTAATRPAGDWCSRSSPTRVRFPRFRARRTPRRGADPGLRPGEGAL